MSHDHNHHHEHKQPASKKLAPERKAYLVKLIRAMVLTIIGYNIIEAIIALTVAAQAQSSALLGFGLDSVVEVSSALIVVWQFSGKNHEAREKIALKLIAITFFALAIFVTGESITSLIAGEQAKETVIGMLLAAASLVIMPVVSYIQRRAGRELGSASAVADSKQTLLCTYLSGVLLVGLGLNAAFGWWWADSVAALVIAGFALREGVEAWRGDACAPSELLFENLDEEHEGHKH
jgi:divalent metal cation (Fe/Co/Zn/Cd) transporter